MASSFTTISFVVNVVGGPTSPTIILKKSETSLFITAITIYDIQTLPSDHSAHYQGRCRPSFAVINVAIA